MFGPFIVGLQIVHELVISFLAHLFGKHLVRIVNLLELHIRQLVVFLRLVSVQVGVVPLGLGEVRQSYLLLRGGSLHL